MKTLLVPNTTFLNILFLLFITQGGFAKEYDQAILNEIEKRTAETHSDAVIIKQNGKVLYRSLSAREEQPIYIASAGKSLTSLAIGKLIDNGQLESVDTPIHTFFSEWKQGKKQGITVRMLLNHTSGLQNHPNASIELEPAPDYQVDDVIKLALAAELSHAPGEYVSYNNKAVALLGGVVQKLSGKKFDEFFVDEFYQPMNITQYKWIKDRNHNPTVHGAFVIKPSDLIKFGELMLNKGIYSGKRVISQDWITNSLKQGHEDVPTWGLLWWRLPKFEKRIIDEETWATWINAKVDEDFLKKIKPIKGRLFDSKNDFYTALNSIFGKNWNHVLNETLPNTVKSSKRIFSDEIIAYYANGFRGNYLVIVPKYNIVAVRCADFEGFNHETDSFSDFVTLVAKLGK